MACGCEFLVESQGQISREILLPGNPVFGCLALRSSMHPFEFVLPSLEKSFGGCQAFRACIFGCSGDIPECPSCRSLSPLPAKLFARWTQKCARVAPGFSVPNAWLLRNTRIRRWGSFFGERRIERRIPGCAA
jgi:hypothetical protein